MVTPNGPRFERETVVIFNEEDGMATIWTASGVVDRKLRKLGFELTHGGERHSEFVCLKKQVNLRRKTRISASTGAKAAARLRNLKGGRFGPQNPEKQGSQPHNGVRHG